MQVHGDAGPEKGGADRHTKGSCKLYVEAAGSGGAD